MTNAVESTLIEYVKTTLDVEVTPHTLLIEKGIIDSMGIMDLITYIGSAFGVEFELDDMTEERLGTISSIAALIASKKEAS